MIEKFPTSTSVIVPGWDDPTYAYAFDGRVTCSFSSGAEQEYSGFNFNLTGTIEAVNIKVCFFTAQTIWYPDSSIKIEFWLKAYNGTWQSFLIEEDYLYLTGDSETDWADANSGFYYYMLGLDLDSVINTIDLVNNMKVRIVSLFPSMPTTQGSQTVGVDAVSVEVCYEGENATKYMLIGSIFSTPIMLAIALHYRKHQKT